ncbi:SH3-domain-containing protein [Glonium stellatum]|uniref:SH3-domain-containing protein n=1 Tax=Glonium stellatum TaxID=574774 RepID=A0A8E2EWC3_9PEZI|nr:SH3-domain-containing protein [Glonium stellatum]
MALQLAPAPGSDRGEGSVYGGSQRGRGGSNARPMSAYYAGNEVAYSNGAGQLSTRVRSKSVAEPRQYTKEGRMILHYSRAMYMYQAQIPEELSFAKGDILAVLRLQDDGWWEAEVVGKNGRPGLVPSNYLQNC